MLVSADVFQQISSHTVQLVKGIFHNIEKNVLYFFLSITYFIY